MNTGPKKNDGKGPLDDLDRRLDDLDRRLEANRGEAKSRASAKSDGAGFGQAMRLSSEFIAAILVGAAIGYGIDWALGTGPWAMIIFLMLGFVAGILNVLRASGEISGPNYRRNPPKGEENGG